MSREVALPPSEVVKRLQAASQRLKAGSSGMQFMKFNKDGTWTFGADDIEPEEGSLWAVHPLMFREGFIAWSKNNEVLGEAMALTASEPPILQHTLEPFPRDICERGWAAQGSLVMVCLSGEDKGVQVEFKSSSKGGKDEIGRLLDEVCERVASNPEEYMPVVKLENDSYKHKKWGKIYTPVLDIVDWTTFDAADFTVEEEKEEEEAPARKKKRPEPETRRAKRVEEEEAEDADYEEVDDEDAPEDEPPPVARRRRRR